MFRGKGRLFVICIVLAVLMTVFAKKNPAFLGNAGPLLVDVSKPIVWVLSRPIVAFEASADFFHNVGVTWRDNKDLRQQVAVLQENERELLILREENSQLRNLLHYTSSIPFHRVAVGRVFADINTPFLHTVLVSAGSNDGVASNMIAFDHSYVVGHVLSVGRFYTRVLLLSDNMSRVPVASEDNSVHAILVGRSGDKAELMYYPKHAVFFVGEKIITSGVGGVFPPGLPVGVVSDVKENTITVTLDAHFNALSYLQFFSYKLANPLAVMDDTVAVAKQVPARVAKKAKKR